MAEPEAARTVLLKISIITVTYNSAATLEQNIISVAAQCYSDVEHIIVDGASTDGTLNVLARHRDKLSVMVSEPDRGIYDAMNKGISLATGDVIGTLNSDDVYADETVLSQVSDVFSDPAVDACFADLVYVQKHDVSKIVRYWKSRPYTEGLFERGWMPAHPTFFVRRRIFERLGAYDLNFPRQADFELTMRFLAIHQIKSVYVPRVWVKMRMGGMSNNSLRGIIVGNLEAWRACRKNGLAVGPLFMFRKVASRLPQYFSRPS